MADLIDRQALLGWFENWSDYDEFSVGYITGVIKDEPSAQPEIIRCKDCKYYDGNPCEIVDYYNTADDFCSYAERRTDG